MNTFKRVITGGSPAALCSAGMLLASMPALAQESPPPAGPGDYQRAATAPSVRFGPVSLFGKLELAIDYLSGGRSSTGVDVPGRSRVANYSSFLGVGGEKRLAEDLIGTFQLEASLNLANGSGGTLGSRNNQLGLRGSWGRVMLGQWDTPYEEVGRWIEPFGTVTIAGWGSIFGNQGLTPPTGGNSGNGFLRRQSNSIQYWSPDWEGFNARVMIGPNMERKAAGINPSLASLSLHYERGPVYLGFGYEEHKDYGGVAAGVPGTRDTGQKLVASYTIGSTRLMAAYERLKYEPSTTTTLARNAGLLGIVQKVSERGEIRADYLLAGNTTGNHKGAAIGSMAAPSARGTGAKQISVGYFHHFAKDAIFYGIYSKIENKPDGLYSYMINSLLNPLIPGVNQQAVSAGIKFFF